MTYSLQSEGMPDCVGPGGVTVDVGEAVPELVAVAVTVRGSVRVPA